MSIDTQIMLGIEPARYRSWGEISQSIIKHGRSSMAHLRAAWDRALAGESEPTDAMQLGTAVHAMALEGQAGYDRIAAWSGGIRRGKAWDAFEADAINAGKILVTTAQYDTAARITDAIGAAPQAQNLLLTIAATEVTARGFWNGLPVKGRADAITSDHSTVIDLKVCRSTEPTAFMRSAFALGYHIQAAVYLRLFDAKRFVIIAVESSEPHDVVVYEFSPQVIRFATAEVDRIVAGVLRCIDSGKWPGRSAEVETIQLPAWMADADDSYSPMTIGGVAAFATDADEVF